MYMRENDSDIVGRKYNKLTVVRRSGKVSANRIAYWICSCECGLTIETRMARLKSGTTASCGCNRQGIHTTHGHTKRSVGRTTKTYSAWTSMKDRVLNINHPHYKDYGDRGITIAETWLDFRVFLADMGEAPIGLTLERVDNSLGYSKDNCIWTTFTEQNRNRRSNVNVTINGITKCLQAWGEVLEIKTNLLAYHAKRKDITMSEYITNLVLERGLA